MPNPTDSVTVVYRISTKTGQPYAVLARSDAPSHYPYLDVITVDKWPVDPRMAKEHEVVYQSGHFTWYRDQTRGFKYEEVKAFHWLAWRRLLSLGYRPEQIKLRKKLPPHQKVFKRHSDADTTGLLPA